jgi:hypothetical protein
MADKTRGRDTVSEPHGAGREERVAGPPEDACSGALLVAEASQKRRLPASGLACDEQEPPIGALHHSGEGVAKRNRRLRALEQLAWRAGPAQG